MDNNGEHFCMFICHLYIFFLLLSSITLHEHTISFYMFIYFEVHLLSVYICFFLTNCAFYHYEMSFFISGNKLCLEDYLSRYEYNHSSLLVLVLCAIYFLFLLFTFNLILILYLKWVPYGQI